MSKPKVLLLGSIDYAHSDWKSFSETVEIITPKATSRQEFIDECHSGAFDNVIAAYRTFQSARITGRFDTSLVSALPKSWKFLCHVGAGYDQIDPDPCISRDPPLLVSNVPTAVDDATADTAIFLMLGALRNFQPALKTLRAGSWRGQPAPSLGHDPRGKTLGILGMGGIGANMARKASAFGMTVIYHNRRQIEGSVGARYVGFEELLRESDVLSLNLPLNEKTRRIIGKKEFQAMKRTAILVNTARGGVVDEAALVEALREGEIARAGLDVFEEEPNIHEGLLGSEKVILLPHMGTYTWETMMEMERWCIDNVRSAVETGKLKSIIPEQRHLQ